MEIAQDTQFIKDHTGQNVYAIIPIDRYNSYIEYEKIMEELEDEESYAEAKKHSIPAEPIDIVIKRLEEKRKQNGIF